jgi:hypothetical protein
MAPDILDERYARGEIDAEEYLGTAMTPQAVHEPAPNRQVISRDD